MEDRGSVEGEEGECDGGTRVSYSGKFSNGANFRTFHVKPRDKKIKTAKSLRFETSTTSNVWKR